MDLTRLVRDCLRKKPEAQKQLYDEYAKTMLGVCYRYTKSLKDAEDVLQDAFVKVYQNLHQYRSDGELGAWIRRIMVNTALNFLKKNKRYQREMCFSDAPLHKVSEETPLIRLQAKELADLIRQLPPGYQAVFNLFAIEGYSHIEIGEMLGISDGTSRSQYARARALLIRWIDNNNLATQNISYAGK